MAVEVVKKLIVVADTPDAVGRIYPREELLKVAESNEGKTILGSFVGIDCTDDVSKSAIQCSKIRMEGNALVCDFKILDTAHGYTLQTMIREHAVALTPFGVGKLENNIVSDYELRQINVKMC